MNYKALVDFKDLASGKEYKAGDTVDLSGASASKVLFMLQPNNNRGALIEEAKGKTSKVKEEPTKEIVDEIEEKVEPEEPQGV